MIRLIQYRAIILTYEDLVHWHTYATAGLNVFSFTYNVKSQGAISKLDGIYRINYLTLSLVRILFNPLALCDAMWHY